MTWHCKMYLCRHQGMRESRLLKKLLLFGGHFHSALQSQIQMLCQTEESHALMKLPYSLLLGTYTLSVHHWPRKAEKREPHLPSGIAFATMACGHVCGSIFSIANWYRRTHPLWEVPILGLRYWVL